MKSLIAVSVDNANGGTTEYACEGDSLTEAREGLVKKLLYVVQQAQRAEKAATEAIATLEETVV